MNFILFLCVFIAIFFIAVFDGGVTAVFVVLLCACCFVWGVNVYSEIVINKANNAELIDIKDKYYEVKYVKDKVQ